MLLKGLPEGIPARAYGWHVNNNAKEAAVIDFFQIPLEFVANVTQRSGWKTGFFQRAMHEITDDKREPVRWILRGDSAPNAYLAAARTQAKEHKVGLILRRGGRNNIGLLGAAPEESFEAPLGCPGSAPYLEPSGFH